MLCYALAAAGFVVFLVTEFNVENPLVQLRLLVKYNFGAHQYRNVHVRRGHVRSVFLIPVYLQNILGYTALESGMVLLPIGIIQAVTGPIAGYFSDKVNPRFLL